MMDSTKEWLFEENQKYYERLEICLRGLFDRAREANELHFACSLSPEFRGAQDVGWNTAHEAVVAFDEYTKFINEIPFSALKARIALSFYTHLSEASGFYEILKNMLRVAGGEAYSIWPFMRLVEKHKTTGARAAPNANKIIRDLVGHAETIGLSELASCIREAYDPDLRNGYAHADYIIWAD